MHGKWFSQNGQILPIAQALLPAHEIERMYGFGVYETMKVRNGTIYFAEQHIDRLFHSARCIELAHSYTKEAIIAYSRELVHAVKEESLNIKLLLLGGTTPAHASLLLFPLAPFFPKKQWYREGVTLFSFEYERWMPQAKTLNMLPSYYYFTKSQERGGYDALFIDHRGHIREGSRTNVYLMKGTDIVSPPKEDILEGVTMMTLEKVIAGSRFKLSHQQIPLTSLATYDGMFLTSTSTKVIPVRQIDDFRFPQISSHLSELMGLYNEALDTSQGVFAKL